jgi:photosystem II stability/assembly factor-like uncharacterized protein
MKTFLLATLASALFISSFSFFNSKKILVQINPNSEDEAENKYKPNDQFAASRMYPDKEFEANYYKDLVLNASQSYYASQVLSKSLNTNAWQVEGPHNIGGRIMSIAVNAQNQNTMLIGAAAGGIFKTKNGGTSWYPVFDNGAFLSISDIKYDPIDTNVLYAATGDKATSFYSYLGDGIYKSTDGGETWNYLGLNQVGIVSKIIVHPTNSSIIYAGVQGNYWTKDLNRGVYKTIDAGITWNKVLATDSTTGICDMEINKQNPNIIYAVTFTRYRTPFITSLGGLSTKVLKTIDGGTTWNSIFDGSNVSTTNLGKMGLAISEQNPNKLYLSATIGGGSSEQLFSSIDAGATWNILPANGAGGSFGGFSWYFDQVFVNPYNDNVVLLTGVNLYESTDGGNNFSIGGTPWFVYDLHADKHDVQFLNATDYIVTTDGGTYKMTIGDSAVQRLDYIPITQFYRVSSNMNQPLNYYGGAQDNGSTGGNVSTINNWPRLCGGDGFSMQFPQFNNNYFYAETQNGDMIYIDTTNFTYSSILNGINPSERKNWDFPYMISKYSDDIMYCGTDKIYEGEASLPDQVQWIPNSGDLTKATNSSASTIRSIDEGLTQGRLITGTGDGNVWKRENFFAAWQNITGTLPNRTVTCVKFSPNINNNLYVSHSGYKFNEYIPHLHRSTDNGVTWVDISSNLPNFGINDIYVWQGNENIIFIANDIGVYYTADAGLTWNRLGNNMPFFPVYDIDFNPGTNKFFAGTFARSIQSIDISNITGISKVKQNDYSINVFPNPAKDALNIKTNLSKIEKKSIYDLKGRLVLEDISGDINMNISTLQKGYYLLVLNSNGNKVVKKFVKE